MNRLLNPIELCFDLALKGLGNVSPNPLVGAVIVKDEEILGQGFHARWGEPHAEIMAIQDALSKGHQNFSAYTLYCNLEPCCHTSKRTPPCAQEIVRRGFRRVVISNLDPNPQVSGKGVELLRQGGVEVEVGIHQKKGELLNEVFFHWIKTKKPFVHLKWAQSADGFLAPDQGPTTWMTSELSRQKVHLMRQSYDAIVVGGETLRQDNPHLGVRLEGPQEFHPRDPFRLILTRQSDYPPKLKAFRDAHFLLTTREHFWEEVKRLGFTSLLVEGGPETLRWFWEQQAVQRLSFFRSPLKIGQGKKFFLNPETDLPFSWEKSTLEQDEFFTASIPI